MSRFNAYAKKLDEIAQSAFREYQKAQEQLATAAAATRQYPTRKNPMPAEYTAKSARAAADYAEAKAAVDRARHGLEKGINEIAALRRELVAEIEDAYCANPAQIDNSTLTLLQSGILRSGEYSKLLQAAQEAGNVTMMRLIGKFAFDAAEKANAHGDKYSQDVQELRAVYNASRRTTGDEYLQRFDYLSDVYARAVDTPELASSSDRWGRLAGEVVESF